MPKAQQLEHADLRLSVCRRSRLQCRPRTGVDLLGARPRRILNKAPMTLQEILTPRLGEALRPNIWDVVALILVIGAMVLIVYGGEQTTLPLSALDVDAGFARSRQSAALRAAHDDADAAGDRLLDRLHLHLCGARRQEPARRDGADPAARHPAVGADPRLSDLHRRVLPEPVSRPACSAPSSPACSRSSPARPGT